MRKQVDRPFMVYNVSDLALMTINNGEPVTYGEAINSHESSKWRTAMDEEFNALQHNNTWTLVKLPADCKAIGSKWVYKKKINSDGTVERFKARLCAKGFTQQEGIDYNETFAPVVKYKSLRIVLAVVVNKDYELQQMDVQTAFLNANIKETVYMKQAVGYEKGGADIVCKLNKTIYGTKQASHEWNNEINNFITNSLGFKRCISDTCIYVKISDSGNVMIIAIFVDDIISAFNHLDTAEWNHYKAQLSQKYTIKDLGNAEWILGMKITRDRSKRILCLDQEVYINKVLQLFNMNECKSSHTPEELEKLSDKDCPKKEEEKEHMKLKPYESLVGSLLYAAISTRPDLSHAVNMVSRFMKNPGERHWIACKRILRYLKGTNKLKLVFEANQNAELVTTAYTDADWGGDLDDRKSTTGYIIKVNDCLVSWISKKQRTVALSSAESEYMAISAALQEIKWINQLLEELTFKQQSPTKLFSDSQAAIAISGNDINHNRTKHIDIRHHFIRDAIKGKEVELEWVQTAEQEADILTKALGRIQFERLREKIMKYIKDVSFKEVC
jgi:hypothetical protein